MINYGKNVDWKQNIRHGKVGVTAHFGKKWCRWRNSKENFIKWAEVRKWREWVKPASSRTVACKRQRNRATGEESKERLGSVVCFYMLCPCRYWRMFVYSWKQSRERERETHGIGAKFLRSWEERRSSAQVEGLTLDRNRDHTSFARRKCRANGYRCRQTGRFNGETINLLLITSVCFSKVRSKRHQFEG